MEINIFLISLPIVTFVMSFVTALYVLKRNKDIEHLRKLVFVNQTAAVKAMQDSNDAKQRVEELEEGYL